MLRPFIFSRVRRDQRYVETCMEADSLILNLLQVTRFYRA